MTPAPKITLRFWFSEHYGLIRQRQAPGLLWHPELWKNQQWVTGSAYLMDAITGLGEDVWSSGEYAEQWSQSQAEAYAVAHSIDLFAPNAAEVARPGS